MIENRQDGEPFNLDALKALNPDASMKKGGILKTAGPKVCRSCCPWVLFLDATVKKLIITKLSKFKKIN